MIRLTCRTALIVLVAAITLLSVVPPLWRPVTSAPHSIEHLLVFVVTGLALAMAYSWRWWLQAAALALFAVAIEAAQLFVPGRHARLSDLAVHLAGAGIGIAAAHLAAVLSRSARQPDAAPGRAPR